MCGRFRIQDQPSEEKLAELYQQAIEISLKLGAKMITSGDVRPTDVAPVIAPSARNRTLGAFPMQWGFTHPKRGMLVFNTRSETARERDMLAGSVDDRRCLVPATCYYEWKKIETGKKERYAFRAQDGAPLLMAGLYIRTSDVRRLPCFTILTQDAHRSIQELHPRMPVLVPFDRAEEWLSPDTDFLRFIQDLRVQVIPESA
jgi:putative SOS response-associated peptidase YedK